MRENIPVVAVVFNNGQWGAEKKNQIDFYADRYLGTNLVEPELRRHRRGHGRATASRSTIRVQVGDALQGRRRLRAGRPCWS